MSNADREEKLRHYQALYAGAKQALLAVKELQAGCAACGFSPGGAGAQAVAAMNAKVEEFLPHVLNVVTVATEWIAVNADTPEPVPVGPTQTRKKGPSGGI